jgi:hypothetical protein
MVEIIITREMVVTTGLDKRTLVIPPGSSIILRRDNGDISFVTTQAVPKPQTIKIFNKFCFSTNTL